jgi:hypothetical protein
MSANIGLGHIDGIKRPLGQISSVKVRINQGLKFSEGRKSNYVTYGLNGTSAPEAGRCTNIACHFQKTPKW